MVVLVTVALVGVAVLVGLNMNSGRSEPEPAAPPPAQPARDTSAPVTPTPPAAAPETPRTSRRAAPAPKPAAVTPPPAVVEAPTMATLHITSDVPGAQVFIDRKFIGVAPVTAEDVAPGSRQINVSAPGYDGVVESVDIAPGTRDVMISLKAIRLDESIAVTHKHGMGSCKGRLIATPEGLRYETDNKNDGFAVPLGAIETFTADFLAKNLKVKVKGGRTYDFTDPGGKADPLYLFHQAVEKARVKQGAGKNLPEETR
jgi:hypothetical protein